MGDGTQWSDSFTLEDYNALVKDMFDGKIKVSASIDEMPATTNAEVQDLGNIK
jgi:hypothetical protein